jgi:hypothetical protein
MTALKLRIIDARRGIRVARSRMPFRYGSVTVRDAPILTLEVTIETEGGRRACGYSADFLAYRWFDKRAEKSLADNVADLLSAVDLALEACRGQTAYVTAFDLWSESFSDMRAKRSGLNDLTLSFGASMPERAVIDALGRLLGKTVSDVVRSDALGLDLVRLDPDLAGFDLAASLPARPLEHVWVRHTVGLLDPLRASDVRPGEEVEDGFPETLEEYLRVDRLRYLKIKVGGRLEEDRARLSSIARLTAEFPCAVTLDGNEQYTDLAALEKLLHQLRSTPELEHLYDAILYIEQPLARSTALSPDHAACIRRLGKLKPLIIDEADGTPDSFKLALSLGYAGVSHKNCKGIYKSILNFARVECARKEAERQSCFLSAEDLTNLPVVPLHADLAMVTLLGITHAERNGHHYFRGLEHLPEEDRASALADHPDIYERRGASAALRISDGRVTVRSLQVPGFGFSAPPQMEKMLHPESWLDTFSTETTAER